MTPARDVERLRRENESLRRRLAEAEEKFRAAGIRAASSPDRGGHAIASREVEESEAKFKALFEHSPDAVFLTNTDGRILSANPAARVMFGMTEEELRQCGRSGIVDPDDPRLAALLDERRRTGVLTNCELTYIRGNGERLIGETSSVILPGDASQSFVVVRDITERKRREANLAFIAEMGQDFGRLSSPKDIMQAVGAKVAGYLRVSHCFFAAIDEAADQAIVECAWSAAGSPEMAGTYALSAFVTEEFTRAARAGDTIVVRNTQTDPRTDAAAHGALKIHASVSVPFHLAGEWKYLLTVTDSAARDWREDEIQLVHEVTARTFLRLERAKAEAALRLSEQKFATAFAGNAAAIALTRLEDGRFLEVNDTWLGMNGYERRDEVIGRSARTMGLWQSQEAAKRFVNEMATKGSIRGWELEFLKKSGEPFLAEMSATVLSVHGEPVILSTLVDITERKRVEQHLHETATKLEEANRIKDNFLATLSHELRTPMSAIVGWAQMLTTRKMDGATTERALHVILRNAQAQMQLINDILDVSRIASGRLRLDIRPVDLVSVVYSALDAVRPAAEAKDVSLDTSIAASSTVVSGDADRLQQVAWNLLSNAVKFTPKGGRVEVAVQRTGSRFMLRVRDNGAGISEAFLPRVFEPFTQQDTSARRQHAGLGLGLSIVRHLVELHGGTVEAESEGEGRGTTFTIHLPIRTVDEFASAEDARKAPDEERPDAPGRLAGVCVLVVDDEADARELIATLLGGCGADVTTVASAVEALARLRDGRFDVLVADIGMPRQDGYELMATIRQLPDDARRSIPAVALTAYGRPDDSARALAAGFQVHLTKPASPGDLASAIAHLVNVSRTPGG